MKIKRITYCFIALTSFQLLQSCKDDTLKDTVPDDKTMTGNFRYYGGNYNVAQADCGFKKYSVVNPKYGQSGQPLMIDADGLEINLWSYPAGQEVLLNFQVTGNSAMRYTNSNSKPNGFRLNMYEKGTVYKRTMTGNSDTAWIEINKLNMSDSLVSGSFYIFDRSLLSGGSDFYAITKGEFKNVKVK